MSNSRLVRITSVFIWVLAITLYLKFTLGLLHQPMGFDIAILYKAEVLLKNGHSPYGLKGFVYPPPSALFLLPIAYFHKKTISILAVIVNTVLYFAILLLSYKLAHIRILSLEASLIALIFYFSQTFQGELELGNLTAFIVFLLVVQLYLISIDRWTSSVAVLAISLMVKPMLIFIGLIYLVHRKYKSLGFGILLFVIGFVASLPTIPQWNKVFSKLPSVLNRSGSGIIFNSAYVGILRYLKLDSLLIDLIRLFITLLIVIAFVNLDKLLLENDFRITVEATLILLWTFLCGTLSEYHYMLCFIPIICFIVSTKDQFANFFSCVGILWLNGILLPIDPFSFSHDVVAVTFFRMLGMTLLAIGLFIPTARIKRFTNKNHFSYANFTKKQDYFTSSKEPKLIKQ